MAVGMREIVAVVVAADSPLGRAGATVDELTSHLPPPGEHQPCPLCPRQAWPCAGFDLVATRLQSAYQLGLGMVVPLDLHPRLWPPDRSRLPSPDPAGGRNPEWFDREQFDG
jgi:hypothetical protein